ncbi:hypothetical protein V5E97_32670 [Singulisphaera sp. Ch08]|uniref:Uncharacterized protein n=1 Tax=Singulisphaera sp. Ch08 TaxID=3120278 RepID=A0AAU7CDD2_9BACT
MANYPDPIELTLPPGSTLFFNELYPDAFDEDLVQIELANGNILDLGWYHLGAECTHGIYILREYSSGLTKVIAEKETKELKFVLELIKNWR